MNTKQTLLDFTALSGVSGREDEAAEYAASLLSRYGDVSRSPMGSVSCRVWAPRPGGPHLLLDAHMDEVGLVVTYIEDSGFLRVDNCGGIDRRALPASPIVVHTQGGKVYGVICSTPPHLDGGTEKKYPKPDELYVDIGCKSREQAQGLVSLGDRATIHACSHTLLGGQVCGKAIDDRAGCVSLLYALELLRDSEPTCGLTVLFSTMEETGGQGARTAAQQLAPTHAVAVDVSFAHTPDASRAKCGLMGKGPMIGIAPILNSGMTRELIDAAEAEGIPYQREVMAGRTATNADQIVTAGAGVATGLLSIPLKYMHTPVETVAISDVENTGKLLAAYIRRFGREGGGV